MRLRLELFVTDLARSRAFYGDELGFAVVGTPGTGYVQMQQGQTVISLNRHDALPPDHPIRGRAGEPVGLGIEIVLEVADLEARYAKQRARGIALCSELDMRPWGLRDFRIADPDGYYLRLTERRAG